MTRRPADLSSDRVIMIVKSDDDVTAERSTAWLGRHGGGEPVALSYPSIPTHAVRRVPIAPPETVRDPFETKLQPSMPTETSMPGPDGYTNCSKSTRQGRSPEPSDVRVRKLRRLRIRAARRHQRSNEHP